MRMMIMVLSQVLGLNGLGLDFVISSSPSSGSDSASVSVPGSLRGGNLKSEVASWIKKENNHHDACVS
jgi:hypothetical protein